MLTIMNIHGWQVSLMDKIIVNFLSNLDISIIFQDSSTKDLMTKQVVGESLSVKM